MAAFEQQDNSGALFRNKEKKSENSPDSSGTVKIEGVEYYINGWTKVSKAGEKFVSLSFKRKEAKPAAKPNPAAVKTLSRNADDFHDDPLPF